VAEEREVEFSDDAFLMESMQTPEDFALPEPADEIAPTVAADTKKDKPFRRVGSRYPEGYEQPLPTAYTRDQRRVWDNIRDYAYKGARDEGKSLDEAYEISRKKANRVFLYGDLDESPLEDYEPPSSIVGAGGRIVSRRRIIRTQDRESGVSQFEQRLEESRRQEKAYRSLIQKEGGEMATLKKVFSDSPSMTEDEAIESGIQAMFERDPESRYLSMPKFSDEKTDRQTFFGRDKEDGVDPDVGFFDDPYIPYGIKNIPNLVERAAIKIGIPNMFANLVLEDDEMDAYLKETRLAIPTENFERIMETVQNARDRGMTDEKIKKDLQNELAMSLTMQSYSDLPAGFQMKAPSVDLFSTEVSLDPDTYLASSHQPLVDAAKLAIAGSDRKEIQKKLNKVSLGALPNSVIAGSIPSTVRLIDETLKSVDRVIEAKGEPGEAGRVLAKSFANTTYSTEKIGDEVMVVENTIGKAFRLLGLFTEFIAESDVVRFGATEQTVKETLKDFGLPEDLANLHPAASPIFPASRDFYYNYGFRDVDSTVLSRALSNLATDNQGFQVHMTNEARADGFERGDPEFHAKLFVGGLLDFLVPWEKLHYGPVMHSVKATARGSSLVKKLGASGYKTRAFLAGASPALYDRIYNVSERATLALDNIKNRIGDEPTKKSIKKLLDEDDAVQKAMAENKPLPKNKFGGDVEPLTLNERNFSESILEQMETGESFQKSFDTVKRDYKPDVFETSADVAAAVTKHVLETDEGIYLFSRGAPGSKSYKPGIIPWQMEPQLERAFAAAGIKYSDIKAALKQDIGGKSQGYLTALRSMIVSGADTDTIDLRNSKPYVAFRKKLESLIAKGEMTTEQKVVLLAIMETRAHNSAAVKNFKTIAEPEDFFSQSKIKKSTPKLDDGSLGTAEIRIQVGKNVADIDLKSVNDFIDILKAKDNLSMNRLFSGDNRLLVDLMGKLWTSRFVRRFGSEENTNKAAKMPKRMLNDDGRKVAEERLRTIIRAEGRLDSDTIIMRELYANLSSIYGRLGEDFKRAAISKGKIAALDELYKPDQFFKNSAVILNRARPNRPGTRVTVSAKLSERVAEEIRRSAGTKRVFADIDVQPEYVKQSMGITKNTTTVDAIEAISRGVGYVVAETMKKEEASKALRGMQLVRLTAATFVTKDKAAVIRSRVNGRMASVLGIADRKTLTGKKYLKAKRLKEMADSKTDTISLSPEQQSSFRVFIQRLSSEPFVANKIPDELLGPNAKLDSVSFESYNRVVELLTDVEASSFARRTVYTEAISRSLAYSLLGALRSEGADIIAAIQPLDDFSNMIKRNFVLDDPLREVRPELRTVIERYLSKIEGTRAEVVQLIKKARRESPEATIEDIFDSLRNQLENDMKITTDKIDLIVGEYDIANGIEGKKGVFQILKDFTQAEISRINREFDISEKKKPRQYAEGQEEIVAGEDILGTDASYTGLKLPKKGQRGYEEAKKRFPELYAEAERTKKRVGVSVEEGISRLQYLTRTSTRALFQDLCNTGGFNGISEQVSSALKIIDRYASIDGMSKADIEKLTNAQRVELAAAFSKIQDQLEVHARYVKYRGMDILDAMAGERFQLSKHPEFVGDSSRALSAAGAAYKAFHSGGEGFRSLYDAMNRYGVALDIDPKKMAKYSPAQAYLEMVVRMMAKDKLLGMYDDMIKVGMPGAAENYRIPKGKISPTGAKYSIETPHAFYGRVQTYMDMIFNRSLDIEEKMVTDTGETVVRSAAIVGDDPRYRRASFERLGTKFASDPSNFQDLDAALAAEEILVRFGVRTQSAGQKLTEIVFPDGSITYGPEAIKSAIDDALDRAAAVGSAYGTKAQKVLTQEEFGVPYLDIQKTEGTRNYAKAANVVNALLKAFPVTGSLIKRGITTGIIMPIPAYYISNFLGGALQLFTAVHPIKATSMLIKNPAMVGAVMTRMFGDGEQFSSTVGGSAGALVGGVAGSVAGPLGAAAGAVAGATVGGFTGRKIGRGYQPGGNTLIVAKNGMIYNADQVAELAMMYRLNSSFISAETERSMADDIKNNLRENPTKGQKVWQYGTAWNNYLTECATAIDNFYRVSIFVDRLNDGVSPSQAAGLARRAAFDYGALTDFEKKYMRNSIMFYSYLQKNMELFWDTLLTNPSRVTNQLRLANGLQRSTLEEDPQIVLDEWMQSRLMVGLKSAITNTHAMDSRMYVMPPIPLADSLNLFIDLYDAYRGDEDAQRMLVTRATPWVQFPWVVAFQKDPFYGSDINRYNKVSPALMEWDLAVTGGVLRRTFNVVRDTHRNQRLRLVEGDEDRQYYRAKNGVEWWMFRNLLQIPGAGRSLTVIDAADRANLGVVEGITELLRSMRLNAEEAGFVDKREFEFEEGDTMSPRVGLTPLDELLGIFAIRTQLVPNIKHSREKILREIKFDYKKKIAVSTSEAEQAREKYIE